MGTAFTNELTTQFLDFVNTATSPYHVVDTSKKILELAGFKELTFDSTWNLEAGKSYYTDLFGTSLFAFRLPEDFTNESIFRICVSHTDHPGFRIKPNPDLFDKGYWKLNVETYGGAILNTWMDRPLSLAGKVTLKNHDSVFKPITKIVDFKRPLLTIPNLAIHMNRSINKGVELNKQIDMMPLFSMHTNKKDTDAFNFLEFLAEELKTDKDQILDYDLSVYNCESGCLLGARKEFYSCPRLDNLTSVYASLQAITMTEDNDKDIMLCGFLDNEEIGSRTKQGADSLSMHNLLKKIYTAFIPSEETFINTLHKSYMISADVAHALHPNHPGKNDITNFSKLNEGIVIKWNSNQRYATDTEAIGVIQQICETYAIPYQKFANRSDIPGGGTLGSITSAWLPMKTVDIGVPILAMHSARETGGVQDEISLMRLLHAYFSCE